MFKLLLNLHSRDSLLLLWESQKNFSSMKGCSPLVFLSHLRMLKYIPSWQSSYGVSGIQVSPCAGVSCGELLRPGQGGQGYLAGPGRLQQQQCTTAASASAALSACSTLGWGWGWCLGWGGCCHLPLLPSRLCPLPWPWAWDSRCAGFHSTSALQSGWNQWSGRPQPRFRL